jgi:hypothetical protein
MTCCSNVIVARVFLSPIFLLREPLHLQRLVLTVNNTSNDQKVARLTAKVLSDKADFAAKLKEAAAEAEAKLLAEIKAKQEAKEAAEKEKRDKGKGGSGVGAAGLFVAGGEGFGVLGGHVASSMSSSFKDNAAGLASSLNTASTGGSGEGGGEGEPEGVGDAAKAEAAARAAVAGLSDFGSGLGASATSAFGGLATSTGGLGGMFGGGGDSNNNQASPVKKKKKKKKAGVSSPRAAEGGSEPSLFDGAGSRI